MRTIRLSEAVRAAADLVTEDGASNPEYDRAIYELIGDLWGLGETAEDRRETVADLIELVRR